MDEKFNIPKKFKQFSYLLIAVGVMTFAIGFFTDAQRTWANYLLNNYYFVSIAVGAAFFIAIQYIAQAGWSASFKRIPEAMTAYLPFAAIFFLLLFFGMHSLYHWSHEGIAETDQLIAHKQPYLNIPFFFLRVFVFLGLWVLMTRLIRKISIKEDTEGGIEHFYKLEKYSKILIFIVAITFTLFAIDILMSLEVHWFSTLYAAKSFISAFYHGTTIITLIVIILHRMGHLQMLNNSHLHDFSRYIFMLAIVWGYFNFAQFMLIWYGNIPEETSFYVHRWHGAYQILFFANILINWFIPFLILMPRKTSRSKPVLVPIILILMAGQYMELYYDIWPAVVGEAKFGLLEIGAFAGYLGLFALVTATALTKANLVPKNHPYLEESLHHHF